MTKNEVLNLVYVEFTCLAYDVILQLQEGIVRDLTSKHILKVSRKLTEKYDIRMLGCHLEVPENTIEAIFHNKKDDIQEAVYQMLREWMKSQRTPAEAYQVLWDALMHPDVNLPSIANEVLVDSPKENAKHPSDHSKVRYYFDIVN